VSLAYTNHLTTIQWSTSGEKQFTITKYNKKRKSRSTINILLTADNNWLPFELSKTQGVHQIETQNSAPYITLCNQDPLWDRLGEAET
jgi:hypothetical protein